MRLSYHEASQLRSIGGRAYVGGTVPYYWGEKTMPKLAAKGLVEPHDVKGAWRITDAGRVALLAMLLRGAS